MRVFRSRPAGSILITSRRAFGVRIIGYFLRAHGSDANLNAFLKTVIQERSRR